MGTPLGEKMWTSNIKQIVQATVRSINLAIMNLAVAQETHFQALADTRLRMLPNSVRARQVRSLVLQVPMLQAKLEAQP